MLATAAELMGVTEQQLTDYVFADTPGRDAYQARVRALADQRRKLRRGEAS